ncbi:MAG: hypothetical protein JSU83_18450 [Deltaproteobacteria bacterium]|nr:MAG: hypothetical protein JSU83_18450 [Deltaproteobacteria bacterium]
MRKGEDYNFSDKHKAAEKPNPEIKNEIMKRSTTKEVPCAIAFEIAKDVQTSPVEVGKTLDLVNYRLVKCQLGLFGYRPEKKIVKPRDTTNQDLKNAIRQALDNGRISCKSTWEIAVRFNVGKMTVSGICEAMGIKIKPCQLGAF